MVSDSQLVKDSGFVYTSFLIVDPLISNILTFVKSATFFFLQQVSPNICSARTGHVASLMQDIEVETSEDLKVYRGNFSTYSYAKLFFLFWPYFGHKLRSA